MLRVIMRVSTRGATQPRSVVRMMTELLRMCSLEAVVGAGLERLAAVATVAIAACKTGDPGESDVGAATH